MPPIRPKHPNSALGPRPAAACLSLDALAKRARMLDVLDERLRRLLPETIARECRLADCRNGRLVFLTSSSPWATRLRLHEQTLLAEARIALGERVDRLVVKVAALPVVPHDHTIPKPLSSAAGDYLSVAAESIKDPELKSLYLQLAALAEKPNP
ncbi:MAG: DUF721 domain-containing protein [Dokdonella sp.]